MPQPLLGFLPDVDASTPGALLDCTNVTPNAKGMGAAPTAVSIDGVPALAAECRGTVAATKLDDTRRILAGTAAAIYELSGGAWGSLASGFALGSDERWDFAQFGDSTLAATPSEPIQRSTGAGFAAIAGAPQAKVIEVAADFVMAFNTDAGADVWHCSALLDDTDWVPDIATQSNTGRLVSSPGPIVAAKAFGADVVVYKDRSMFVGRYVGAPAVWQFDQLPVDIGCIGQDAVTDLGGAGHVFVARSDIMLFDGTRPVSIAEGRVRQWFFNNVSQQYLYKTQVLHDKQNGIVGIFYPSSQSTVCDQVLVYHLGTKQWGRMTQTIESVLNFVSPGVTIDGLGAYTIDTLPDVPFDSQYWLSGGRMPAVVTSAHQLATLTGTPGESSITLFEFGDDATTSRLKRVRVAYQEDPTTATIQGSVKMSRGGALVTGGSGTYTAGKFDIRQSGRFHRLTISATGRWTAAAVDFDLAPAGSR